MRKLSLDLEKLSVESFAPAQLSDRSGTAAPYVDPLNTMHCFADTNRWYAC